LTLLTQFREKCGVQEGLWMLFWVELVGYVLIWEFEHDKKGKNLFRSLPQVVEYCHLHDRIFSKIQHIGIG
jgi:hypothetical protein